MSTYVEIASIDDKMKGNCLRWFEMLNMWNGGQVECHFKRSNKMVVEGVTTSKGWPK